MLISFIGCPASGKTTTAAMLFAWLKQHGLSAEFICEEARSYIAAMRYEQGLKPTDKLVLNDKNQQEIMEAQWASEECVTTVCGPSVIVVTDSSALNALLYMTPEARDGQEVQDLLECYEHDLVFYTPPIEQLPVFDPNRVHDEDASRKIDALIPEIISKYAPTVRMIPLSGEPQTRLQQAIQHVMQRLQR